MCVCVCESDSKWFVDGFVGLPTKPHNLDSIPAADKMVSDFYAVIYHLQGDGNPKN